MPYALRRMNPILAVLMVIVSGPSPAQECVDYGAINPRQVPMRWAYPGYGSPIDSVTHGEHGYVLDSEGLKVYDLSSLPEVDPPELIDMRAWAWDLELHDDLLLIATDIGLQVRQLNDPGTLPLLHTVLSDTPPRRIRKDGDTVYASVGQTVWRVACSIDGTEVTRHWNGLPAGNGFAVIDSILWGTDLDSIRSYDLRSHADGVLLGAFHVDHIMPDIDFEAVYDSFDGHVVVQSLDIFHESTSIRFYEIAAPDSILCRWSIGGSGQPFRSGNHLFTHGRFYDISQGIPGSGVVQSIGHFDVLMDGDLALAVGPAHDMAVVDTTDPTLPVVATEEPRRIDNPILRNVGDHGLTASGIWQLPLTGPPRRVAPGIEFLCYDTYAAMDGNRLFTIDEWPLMSVSDITGRGLEPIAVIDLVQLMPDLEYLDGCYAHDGILYMAVKPAGVSIQSVLRSIDVSDPGSPSVLDEVSLPNFVDAVGFAVDEGLLYVTTDGSGWHIVDISAPDGMQRLGSVPSMGRCRAVKVFGDVAALLYRLNGVSLYDVTSPASPRLITTITGTGTVQDITIHGNRAYITFQNGWPCGTAPSWSKRMNVYDLDAYYPSLIGSVYVPGGPAILTAVDGNLTLGTSDGGWYGLPLDCGTVAVEPPPPAEPGATPTALRLLPAVPNPFNPRTTVSWKQARPGRAVVEVFDPAGRRVARLNDGPRSAGRHAMTWDGRDDQGRRLAAGAYMVSVRQGDEREVRKVVLVK